MEYIITDGKEDEEVKEITLDELKKLLGIK